MPPEKLHMTTLEVAHSRTAEDIENLLSKLRPYLEQITDYTYDHPTRLVKPLVSFDKSALALSLVRMRHRRRLSHDRTDEHRYQQLVKGSKVLKIHTRIFICGVISTICARLRASKWPQGMYFLHVISPSDGS